MVGFNSEDWLGGELQSMDTRFRTLQRTRSSLVGTRCQCIIRTRGACQYRGRVFFGLVGNSTSFEPTQVIVSWWSTQVQPVICCGCWGAQRYSWALVTQAPTPPGG